MHNNEFEMPGSALHRLSAVLGAAGVRGDGAGGEGVPGEGVRAGKEGDPAPGGLYAFKCSNNPLPLACRSCCPSVVT